MRHITTIALAFAFAAGSTTAWADTPGPDWMPFDQVVQKIMDAGYSEISELSADDGQWEGEGMKNGQKMEFHADPKTGDITSEKPD